VYFSVAKIAQTNLQVELTVQKLQTAKKAVDHTGRGHLCRRARYCNFVTRRCLGHTRIRRPSMSHFLRYIYLQHIPY